MVYILEGELEIEADGVREVYRAGDFAYLHAGTTQKIIVRDRVKHIYISNCGIFFEGVLGETESLERRPCARR